jgi:hypothetical protein
MKSLHSAFADFESFGLWGDFYVGSSRVFTGSPGREFYDGDIILFIFDETGREIYRADCRGYWISMNDEFVIQTKTGFTIMDRDGNFRVSDEDQEYKDSLHRFGGTILIETVKMNFAVHFRRVQDRWWQEEAFAVYSLDGEMLLDDIFGAIYEAPGPNGGIFVYLDENTCVLLTPDGRTVPVHSAPVVEKVYYGW